MYGWEPTFESLGKPIPKQVSSGWHGLLILTHQHLDAKIVKNFP